MRLTTDQSEVQIRCVKLNSNRLYLCYFFNKGEEVGISEYKNTHLICSRERLCERCYN